MNAWNKSPRNRGPREAALDAEASHWVVRQRAGLDEAGQRELAAWRARDPDHEVAFGRLAAISSALDRARRQGASGKIAAALRVRQQRRRARRVAWTSVGIAALLVVGAKFYPRTSQAWSVEKPAVTAAADSTTLRHLPDGSVVELKGNSEIAVHFDAVTRGVDLVRGEALFHVAKDARHPFIVRADGIAVRAVGTAFNVRLEARQVEVLVTEGKVGVDDAVRGGSLLPVAADGQIAPLVAGQRAVVASSRTEPVRIFASSPLEIEHRLAWRHARADYESTELAAVVDQMNQRNAVHILIADDVIGRLRISGSFPTDDPERFARLAAATFELKYDVRPDGGIVLRR